MVRINLSIVSRIPKLKGCQPLQHMVQRGPKEWPNSTVHGEVLVGTVKKLKQGAAFRPKKIYRNGNKCRRWTVYYDC